MAFTELRQYVILPGQMQNWVKFFEDEIVPYQISKGVMVHNIFQGETDDSVFVWLRTFASEEERERLYAAMYECDEWTNYFGPKVSSMIDMNHLDVIRLRSTPKSPALPLAGQ